MRVGEGWRWSEGVEELGFCGVKISLGFFRLVFFRGWRGWRGLVGFTLLGEFIVDILCYRLRFEGVILNVYIDSEYLGESRLYF